MRIAIDLTPIVPGGENGGAKVMLMALVKNIIELAPEHQFILLTLNRTYKELIVLESKNAACFCIDTPAKSTGVISRQGILNKLIFIARPFLRIIPGRLKRYLREIFFKIPYQQKKPALLMSISADLLFSPFVYSHYTEREVPFVS